MHLHLLLLTTFICTVLAQEETLRNGFAGQRQKGIDQILTGQPNQQLGVLSDTLNNNDANQKSRILNRNGSKRGNRKKPAGTDRQTMIGLDDEFDYDEDEEDGDSNLPESPSSNQPPAFNDAESLPASSAKPSFVNSDATPSLTLSTEPTKDLTSTTTRFITPVSNATETTLPETSSTTTSTVTSSQNPAQNATTTPKPSGNGKSMWRSPLVIWIAIIILAIIVLAVQMPTILYLLCCRNQTQTSEVLLSSEKDIQRSSQPSQSVNQAQTMPQQQSKNFFVPQGGSLAYKTGRPQETAHKYIPTVGVQQQQRQNDAAAMSDAFGTSMNSDAESSFATSPLTSAANRGKGQQQMLPKISYTDQKMSTTSAKKNQAGKSSGKAKKVPTRR